MEGHYQFSNVAGLEKDQCENLQHQFDKHSADDCIVFLSMLLSHPTNHMAEGEDEYKYEEGGCNLACYQKVLRSNEVSERRLQM